MMPNSRTGRAEFDTCLVLCSADRAAVRQWAPSYQRATWMQAPLALVSFVAGVAVWLMSGGGGWLVGAALVGAVVPFTFIVLMPTNHRLLATGRESDSSETRVLLNKWGKLHAVRTLLSLCATGVYVWLVVLAWQPVEPESRRLQAVPAVAGPPPVSTRSIRTSLRTCLRCRAILYREHDD